MLRSPPIFLRGQSVSHALSPCSMHYGSDSSERWWKRHPSLFAGAHSVPGARFPLTAPDLLLPNGCRADADTVLAAIERFLSSERFTTVQNVAKHRIFDIVPVLEGIEDETNVAAILRTAECLGIGATHIVRQRTLPRRVRGARVACGSTKWLFRTRWHSIDACLQHLRSTGFEQIVALTSAGRDDLKDVDWTCPTVVLLGSESDGLSQDALRSATQLVRLSSPGFAGSFNVAAAGAIALHAATDARRMQRNGADELSALQQKKLAAHFAARALPQRQVKALLKRMQPVCDESAVRISDAKVGSTLRHVLRE